jgi:hypothetical protein
MGIIVDPWIRKKGEPIRVKHWWFNYVRSHLPRGVLRGEALVNLKELFRAEHNANIIETQDSLMLEFDTEEDVTVFLLKWS